MQENLNSINYGVLTGVMIEKRQININNGLRQDIKIFMKTPNIKKEWPKVRQNNITIFGFVGSKYFTGNGNKISLMMAVEPELIEAESPENAILFKKYISCHC